MKTQYFKTAKWLLLQSIFALFLCASVCQAQTKSSGKLLALSKADHTLAIVDAASLRVLARVPVGSDPHEVVASSDGQKAYVSIYGGGSLHEINVIDLSTQKPLASIDTRPLWGPHGLAFEDGKVWFTAEGSKAVGRYDPATQTLDWSLGTGQDRTHMIYVTSGAKKIYTTNVSSGTVSLLENALSTPQNFPPPKNAPASNTPPPSGNNFPPPPGGQPRQNWEQTVVPVSRGSEGFDVSPDSTELWTASAEDGKIFIIDLRTKKVTATLEANVNGANRLKFTPDGKLVFITSLQSGNVTVYDAKERKLAKQISIGHGAAGIEMQPDGKRAFVACTADNYVAVIDLSTLAVTNKIDVGGNPDGLAWAAQ